MGSILIKNGTLVDPSAGTVEKGDIFLRNGIIEENGPGIRKRASRVIDAAGMTVFPGLVDLHVHFRDPGQEYKEDIASGGRAAAHGGVTSVLAMPNTRPVIDSPKGVRYVLEKAEKESPVAVYTTGAITKDLAGEELVDFNAMTEAGAKAFSEDGKSIMNCELKRRAMIECRRLGVPVMAHCEDISMARGGVINDDASAARLGVKGIPNAAEDVIAARDCVIAGETGAQLHLCHCSTAGSMEILRAARKAGVDVSAEVCPHHFILTSDMISGDDGIWKVNPPLRTQRDVDALREAIADGTVSCISTDHAPHAEHEKAKGLKDSPFGMTGIEISALLTYTELVKPGIIDLVRMAELMSLNPARILHIPGGSLAKGMPADLAVFDFRKRRKILTSRFFSKGKNTPFAGRTVSGAVMYTIRNGRVIWEEKA